MESLTKVFVSDGASGVVGDSPADVLGEGGGVEGGGGGGGVEGGGARLHVPTKPSSVVVESEVKTTCRYGWLVDDMYVLVLTVLPSSFASSVFVVHNAEVHRNTYTKSHPVSVSKEMKEKLI